MTARRMLWGLILVTGVLRLAWASGWELGNDEAYHYLFTVHPDWSYFDHPPMLALVEELGIVLAGGTVTALSLRLGFVLLFAGSTWLMARLGERFYGPRAGLLAALALNVTAYHSVAAGAFALPDGPLLFFWLLTLNLASAAVAEPASLRLWLWTGLAWGGALLSKYHAVFLPAGIVLYLLLDPRARPTLRRGGPYLAVVVGLLVFAPVLWWNEQHHWASFAFQGGRALGERTFKPDALAGAVFGAAAYLLPWIWLPLTVILARGGWRWFRGDQESAPGERFLICQAIIPLSVFLTISCTQPILPHWTLVGFLALFPLLGRAWERRWLADPRRFERLAATLLVLPIVLALVVLWHAHSGILQRGRPGGVGLVPPAYDLTREMFGWDQVAAELRRRGLLDQPRTFLFTGNWFQSGQLAFATRQSTTPVLCYNTTDARSFAFWSRSEDWVGYDGILVAIDERILEAHGYDRWFTRVEPVGTFQVKRGGVAVRRVCLFRCSRQRSAFPFDSLSRGPTAPRLAQAKSSSDSERRETR